MEKPVPHHNLVVREAVLALGLMLCTGTGDAGTAHAAEPQHDSLQTVLVRLRENERLYRNLEVKWRESYQTQSPKRPSPQMVISHDINGRSVEQDGKYFLDYKGISEEAEGRRQVHRRKAFDGEKTRYLQQRGVYVGNIIDGYQPNDKLFRPHILPVRRFWVTVPLSVWLEGPQAVRRHADGHRRHVDNSRAYYVGRESIGDLVCEHIRVEYIKRRGKTEQVTDQRNFWLATDRNYLPVPANAFNLLCSKDLPIELTELKELREVEPGIWFPYEVHHAVYDSSYLQEDDRLVPSWRDQYVVEEVSLHPQYGDDFFRDVTFPDGTPVYEVSREGKILSSRRVGEKARD